MRTAYFGVESPPLRIVKIERIPIMAWDNGDEVGFHYETSPDEEDFRFLNSTTSGAFPLSIEPDNFEVVPHYKLPREQMSSLLDKILKDKEFLRYGYLPQARGINIGDRQDNSSQYLARNGLIDVRGPLVLGDDLISHHRFEAPDKVFDYSHIFLGLSALDEKALGKLHSELGLEYVYDIPDTLPSSDE